VLLPISLAKPLSHPPRNHPLHNISTACTEQFSWYKTLFIGGKGDPVYNGHCHFLGAKRFNSSLQLVGLYGPQLHTEALQSGEVRESSLSRDMLISI
jgi:hypothetical protein